MQQSEYHNVTFHFGKSDNFVSLYSTLKLVRHSPFPMTKYTAKNFILGKSLS